MDSGWYVRLIDEQPGLCFLSECCRALRLLSGLSDLGCGPLAQRLTKVKSVRAFGARFDCPDFNGRVLLSSIALADLCAQFSYSPRLSSSRLPEFI